MALSVGTIIGSVMMPAPAMKFARPKQIPITRCIGWRNPLERQATMRCSAPVGMSRTDSIIPKKQHTKKGGGGDEAVESPQQYGFNRRIKDRSGSYRGKKDSPDGEAEDGHLPKENKNSNK